MIKKLLSYLGQYKKATLWTPVFVTLEVVMEVVIPLLMANLIDYGIDGGSMPHIVKIGLALLIAAAISLLFGMLAGRSAAAALPKICGRRCITRCRRIPLPISTNFPPPAS